MKKDLVLILVVAALAVAAFLISGERAAPAPLKSDPYRPGGKEPVLVTYRTEGGLSPIAFFEIAIRGPGDCTVRYRTHGGPAVERSHAVSDAAFRDLLERLSRVGFLEVEGVPRSAYYADMATTTVALTIGDQQNQVTIDARRRPSRDISPLLDFFDEIRKAATPEPVSTGD